MLLQVNLKGAQPPALLDMLIFIYLSPGILYGLYYDGQACL